MRLMLHKIGAKLALKSHMAKPFAEKRRERLWSCWRCVLSFSRLATVSALCCPLAVVVYIQNLFFLALFFFRGIF